MNKVNEAGIELLHDFEKLRFRAYDDAQPNVALTENTAIKGHLTIGWGHTGDWIKWNSQIDRVKADELFLESLEYAESIVKKLIKVPLNDTNIVHLYHLPIIAVEVISLKSITSGHLTSYGGLSTRKKMI